VASRQIKFAGITLIWIFKTTAPDGASRVNESRKRADGEVNAGADEADFEASDRLAVHLGLSLSGDPWQVGPACKSNPPFRGRPFCSI
jgi:hypothetical protein